jgi:hypothetical protein
MKLSHKYLYCLIFVTLSLSQAEAAERKISGTYRAKGWCVTNYDENRRNPEKWVNCKAKDSPINSLTIKTLESGDYAVTFEFTELATTPSYCSFSGIFYKIGDTLQLSGAYDALACKIKIHIFKDKFVFEDPERTCHENFCSGTNQSINGFEFFRKNN